MARHTTKNVPILVRVSPELAAALDEIAVKGRRSRVQVIRDALLESCEKNGHRLNHAADEQGNRLWKLPAFDRRRNGAPRPLAKRKFA